MKNSSSSTSKAHFVLPHRTKTLKEVYQMGKKLGEGQFGTTFLCIEKSTGVQYACKSIPKRKLLCKEDYEDVWREIQIMHHLSEHPNVVRIKSTHEDFLFVHIVMELCEGGELFDRIIQKGHYSEKKAAEIIKVIVGVVEGCHSLGVMHRDLKPENFLLSSTSEDATLKATDFGLSVFYKPGFYRSCIKHCSKSKMNMQLTDSRMHEAENQLELSLKESFIRVRDRLKPPLSLKIPSESEYLDLNQAILFGILVEPQNGKIHLTHLHAIVVDGYENFVSLVHKIVNELYSKLLEETSARLIWICSNLVEVAAIGVSNLLISLLRQIVGGDFSERNLWLSMELIKIFMRNWEWILEEHCVLTGAVYTYLRLLADHYRLNGPQFDMLKRMEIDFCIRALRECFGLCLTIGRDLLRLLQDLSHIPEFKAIWIDLLSKPTAFGVSSFTDISQIYHSRTSTRYFLLRVTPEMETQLRFLLTNVTWGKQKRYQTWFMRKFLSHPTSETIICDLVRFICCAHHPSNEIIQSNVISRWAIVGWLLKCCRKNYVEANTKLALFYDWLFFDESIDNIMNIEPAMLLMVNSVPRYIDMTHTLLDFLFLIMDNYDVNRKNIIAKGVFTSFDILIKKGVVHSLETLTSCSILSPFLRDRLVHVIMNPNQFTHMPNFKEAIELENHVSDEKNGQFIEDAKMDSPSFGKLPIQSTMKTNLLQSSRQNFIQELKDIERLPKEKIIENLGKILSLYATCDDPVDDVDSILLPEMMASHITRTFKLNGYEMFSALKDSKEELIEDEFQSATSLVISIYFLLPNRKMQEMILFWLRNSHPGPRLLSYLTSISIDAHASKLFGEKELGKLLKGHINRYLLFIHEGEEGTHDSICRASSMNDALVSQLAERSLSAYRNFLTLCNMEYLTPFSRNSNNHSSSLNIPFNSHSSKIVKEHDKSIENLLLADLKACLQWKVKALNSFCYTIFHHFSDLSIAKEKFIKLFVDHSSHTDIACIQFDVLLKKYHLFGEDTEKICHLVKKSLEWGHEEQQKFWVLLISELSVSRLQVERILIDLFPLFSSPNTMSMAISGLFTLYRSCSPTLELTTMVFSLPNTLGDFSASILASWFASNSSTFVTGLTQWISMYNSKNIDICTWKHFSVNCSVISKFLSYLDRQDREIVDNSNSICRDIPKVRGILEALMKSDNG